MLTLELMQQDAKCFQLPGSLCKSKNWPFDGEKGGPYPSLLIFSLLSFAAEKRQNHFGFFRSSILILPRFPRTWGLRCSRAGVAVWFGAPRSPLSCLFLSRFSLHHDPNAASIPARNDEEPVYWVNSLRSFKGACLPRWRTICCSSNFTHA